MIIDDRMRYKNRRKKKPFTVTITFQIDEFVQYNGRCIRLLFYTASNVTFCISHVLGARSISVVL